MEVIEQIIDVETNTGAMAVLRKRPSHGNQPGVVMFHDGPGIRGATHDFAAKLAHAGFDVVVPDLYHRHGRMIGYELPERQADPTLVEHLWAMMDSLDDQEIQDDLDAAMSGVALATEEPMAAIGFCVGARAVFRTMMRLPNQFITGAMWHPSYLVDDEPDSPHRTAQGLRGELFVGIGADDHMQPQASHQPFLDAIATAEVSIYAGADHGYTWAGWPSYNEAAATDSFERTTALFDRHLSQDG